MIPLHVPCADVGPSAVLTSQSPETQPTQAGSAPAPAPVNAAPGPSTVNVASAPSPAPLATPHGNASPAPAPQTPVPMSSPARLASGPGARPPGWTLPEEAQDGCGKANSLSLRSIFQHAGVVPNHEFSPALWHCRLNGYVDPRTLRCRSCCGQQDASSWGRRRSQSGAKNWSNGPARYAK